MNQGNHINQKNQGSDNIPVLRFPEFKEEWMRKKYGDIFSFRITNSYSRENLNYDDGFVKNIHYGDIHTKFNTLFNISKEVVPFINYEIELKNISADNYCKEGDLIIADASEDYEDVGKCIEIVNLNSEKLLSGLHTILARPDLHKMAVGFNGYLMKSENIRLQIKTVAQGSKVLSISSKRLAEINLIIPGVQEQKRISIFFIALDKKIAELNQKKTLLELYKKSVIQKIFSQEIRFKDDDGKEFPQWENKKLGEIFSIFNGYAFSSNDSTNHGVLWVKITDVGILKMENDNLSYLPYSYIEMHKKFILKKGDYVIALTRPILNGELKIAPINDFFNNSLLNQRVGKIVSDNTTTFIYYLLQLKWLIKEIENNIAGSDPPNLSPKEIDYIKVLIPKKSEQTKIANFLSTIDEKINHCQTQIEKTGQWKKGLLQMMFV